MEINFNLNLDQPLEIPIGYHHILQSILYKLMSGEDGKTLLHEQGHTYKKRQYKLFTFSELHGEYKIKNKRIVFYDSVSFSFRCFDNNIGEQIIESVNRDGIAFGEQLFTDIVIRRKECIIDSEEILIEMDSPVVAYKTDDKSKHTTFLKPNDIEFYQGIEKNFERKYEAAMGKKPTTSVRLSAMKVEPNDKSITKYKDYIIEGYKGIYRLSGDIENLKFLYDVGLGSKNSQGFGLFNVVSYM